MSDAFTPYETGLAYFLERLGQDHPRYVEVLAMEVQLRENMALTRADGDTGTRNVDRNRILREINRLALQTVGISFNTLCGFRDTETDGASRARAEALGPGRYAWEPEMILIPAGEFWMGTDRQDLELAGIEWEDWMEYEIPCQQVHLPDYAIGKYPVTNAEFARFIEDGGYRNSQYWTWAGWEWREREDLPYPTQHQVVGYDAPSQPVVMISWYEAVAYCNWLAATTWRPYRLPTEAEWEKAARGTDGRLWPWGNRWDPCRCNISEGGLNQPTPVGRYSPRGDSPYGVADMAGNVWEWTASEYEPGSSACVVRGGAWDFDGRYARCACRDWGFPDNFNYNVGLRVVVSPGSPAF